MYKEGDQENDIVINCLGRFVNKRLCQVCGLFVGMLCSFTYLPAGDVFSQGTIVNTGSR